MVSPKVPKPDVSAIWLEPVTSMIEFAHNIIYFETVGEEGEIQKNVDVFTYNSIRGVFKSLNGWTVIKYKDILKWFPLPDID